MNRLPRPDFFDDHAALEALSQNVRVGSHPHLLPHVAQLRAGYEQYFAVNGDATRIQPVQIPAQIEDYLRGHYKSPPNDLRHIQEIRRFSDVNTCPMCGSLHSGTLDHLLPKTDFPAFAIFGLNLVPACKCNVLRSTRLTGPNPGERVLHPYFDDILRERIIAARFTELGLVPQTSLRLLVDAADPHFASVDFHLANVVKRTGVIQYLRNCWIKLMRRPGQITTDLRNDPQSRGDLRDILQAELERCDQFYQSKNNWQSVFTAGLLDDDILDWLFDRFAQPGRAPNGPLASV